MNWVRRNVVRVLMFAFSGFLLLLLFQNMATVLPKGVYIRHMGPLNNDSSVFPAGSSMTVQSLTGISGAPIMVSPRNSVSNTGEISSFVQNSGMWSVYFNAKSLYNEKIFPYVSSGAQGGPQLTLEEIQLGDIRPFMNNSGVINMSTNLQVPTLNCNGVCATDGALAEGSFMFYFRDQTHPELENVGLLINFWRTKGAYTPRWGNDGSTPFYSVPLLLQHSSVITVVGPQQQATGTIFPAQSFAAQLTRVQFQNMLNASGLPAAYSRNPSDYRLFSKGTLFELLPDGYGGTPFSAGLSFSQPNINPVNAGNGSQLAFLGRNEGVYYSSNGAFTQGWACVQGYEKSIYVELYAGVKGLGGAYLGTVPANQATEPEVRELCLTGQTLHRFNYFFTDSIRQNFGGGELVTYATSSGKSARLPILPGQEYKVPYYGPEPVTLNGNFEGVQGTRLQGWACGLGIAAPVTVNFYANAPGDQGGNFMYSVTANDTSEAAVDAACGTNNLLHRFHLDITDSVKQSWGGKQVFATALMTGTRYENKTFNLPHHQPASFIIPSMPVALNCVLPNNLGTLVSGGSIDLYTVSTVNYPESCSQKKVTYTCSNGALTRNPSTLTGISKTCSSQNQPITLKGYFDGIIDNKLAGWACGQGVTTSLGVQFYLDNPSSLGGTLLIGTSASSYSEPAVGSLCGTTSSYHRFNLPLQDSWKQNYGGRKIYAEAVSPAGYSLTRLQLPPTYVIMPTMQTTGCTLSSSLGGNMANGEVRNLYTGSSVTYPATCSSKAVQYTCSNGTIVKNPATSTATSQTCNQLSAPATLKGTFEGVGGGAIQGWACGYGINESVHVHFYLDNGSFLGGAIAYSPGGSDIAAACNTPGNGNHRFIFYYSSNAANCGREITAYAMAPSGYTSPNLTLSRYPWNDGIAHFRIPCQ